MIHRETWNALQIIVLYGYIVFYPIFDKVKCSLRRISGFINFWLKHLWTIYPTLTLLYYTFLVFLVDMEISWNKQGSTTDTVWVGSWADFLGPFVTIQVRWAVSGWVRWLLLLMTVILTDMSAHTQMHKIPCDCFFFMLSHAYAHILKVLFIMSYLSNFSSSTFVWIIADAS